MTDKGIFLAAEETEHEACTRRKEYAALLCKLGLVPAWSVGVRRCRPNGVHGWTWQVMLYHDGQASAEAAGAVLRYSKGR